jgi:hypothetical protein
MAKQWVMTPARKAYYQSKRKSRLSMKQQSAKKLNMVFAQHGMARKRSSDFAKTLHKMKPENIMRAVMSRFKEGKLTSRGFPVTDRMQAVAIGLSEREAKINRMMASKKRMRRR